MSPIKGLSEQRRMPRLGKIKLGIKVPNKSGQGEHPEATDTFVMPAELIPIFGEECAELPIMIPAEDDELWASQFYKRYSSSRGLTCRGDGEACRRMLDANTGDFANRDTTEVVWKEGLPCDGVNCPEYLAKPQRCKEVMHLQFIMPDVPGLGVWQIDTSSINSIRNINSAAAMVRFVYKHLAFIPLLLTLEPMQVNNPDDGKKKTVRVLNLRVRGTMRELMIEAAKPFNVLALPVPAESDFTSPVEEDPTGPVTPSPASGSTAQPAPVPAPATPPAPPAKGKRAPVQPGTPPTALHETSDQQFDGIPSAGPVKTSEIKPDAAPIRTESAPPPPPAGKEPIELTWYWERINILRKKVPKMWGEKNTIARIVAMTGKTATTEEEALSKLTPGQAKTFCEYIEEALQYAK